MEKETQIKLMDYTSKISEVDESILNAKIREYNDSIVLKGIDFENNNYALNTQNIFNFIQNAKNTDLQLGTIDLNSEECFFHNTLPQIDINSISEMRWLQLFADDPYNSMQILATPFNKTDLDNIDSIALESLEEFNSSIKSLKEEESYLRAKKSEPKILRDNLKKQGILELRKFLTLRTLTRISILRLSQDPSDAGLILQYKERNQQLSNSNVFPFSGMPN